MLRDMAEEARAEFMGMARGIIAEGLENARVAGVEGGEQSARELYEELSGDPEKQEALAEEIAIRLMAESWLDEKANREEHGLPGPSLFKIVAEEVEDGEEV
jgi:hypothetical protein